MIGPAIVAGLGVAGQLASGLMSARARRAEFDEQIRGLTIKRDQTVGIATAKAAASGVEIGSRSTTEYLKSLTSELNREIGNYVSARNTTYRANLLSLFTNGLAGGAGVASQYMKANPKAPEMPYTGFGSLGWRP